MDKIYSISFWKILLLLGMCWIGYAENTLAAEPPLREQKSIEDNKTYFYNPESNINNFLSLKIAFDTYFNEYGNFQFQPFEQKEMFENALQDAHDGVFLLSSWHYQLLSKEKELKPVLIAVAGGQSVQQKFLLVKTEKPIESLEDLVGKKIATAGSKLYSKNLLQEMFPKADSKLFDLIQFIEVPSEINALISMGYGMDAALTSESSLNKLFQINPKLGAQLKVSGKSEKKILSLAVTYKKNKNTMPLLKILQQMGDSQKGKNTLRMLGIERWKLLDKNDLKLLESQQGTDQ